MSHRARPMAAPATFSPPPTLTAPRPAGARVAHLRMIEMARGVACGWVLLFHSLAAFPPATLTPVLRGVQFFSQTGWLGVHVFFAISGWCIAERVAAARRRAEPVTVYLRERFFRIYPTYWVAFGILLGLRLVALPLNHTGLAQNLPAGARGWVADLLLLNPYLGEPATLSVSWTLVYELGFYLCAAPAIVTWRRRVIDGRIWFAAGALLCFAPWSVRAGSPPWIVLGMWPNFFAGVAAWWIVRRGGRRAGLGLLAALAAMTIGQAAVTDAWGGSFILGRLTAIATGVALVGLHAPAERWGATRSARSLCWLGGISYSLYLIHLPLILPLQNLGTRLVSPSSPAYVLVWLLMLGAAMIGAVMLNRGVEAPVHRWQKR